MKIKKQITPDHSSSTLFVGITITNLVLRHGWAIQFTSLKTSIQEDQKAYPGYHLSYYFSFQCNLNEGHLNDLASVVKGDMIRINVYEGAGDSLDRQCAFVKRLLPDTTVLLSQDCTLAYAQAITQALPAATMLRIGNLGTTRGRCLHIGNLATLIPMLPEHVMLNIAADCTLLMLEYQLKALPLNRRAQLPTKLTLEQCQSVGIHAKPRSHIQFPNHVEQSTALDVLNALRAKQYLMLPSSADKTLIYDIVTKLPPAERGCYLIYKFPLEGLYPTSHDDNGLSSSTASPLSKIRLNARDRVYLPGGLNPDLVAPLLNDGTSPGNIFFCADVGPQTAIAIASKIQDAKSAIRLRFGAHLNKEWMVEFTQNMPEHCVIWWLAEEPTDWLIETAQIMPKNRQIVLRRNISVLKATALAQNLAPDAILLIRGGTSPDILRAVAAHTNPHAKIRLNSSVNIDEAELITTHIANLSMVDGSFFDVPELSSLTPVHARSADYMNTNHIGRSIYALNPSHIHTQHAPPNVIEQSLADAWDSHIDDIRADATDIIGSLASWDDLEGGARDIPLDDVDQMDMLRSPESLALWEDLQCDAKDSRPDDDVPGSPDDLTLWGHLQRSDIHNPDALPTTHAQAPQALPGVITALRAVERRMIPASNVLGAGMNAVANAGFISIIHNQRDEPIIELPAQLPPCPPAFIERVLRKLQGIVRLHSDTPEALGNMIATALPNSVALMLPSSLSAGADAAVAIVQTLKPGNTLYVQVLTPELLAAIPALQPQVTLLLDMNTLSQQDAITMIELLQPGCILGVVVPQDTFSLSRLIAHLPKGCAWKVIADIGLKNICSLASDLPDGTGLLVPPALPEATDNAWLTRIAHILSRPKSIDIPAFATEDDTDATFKTSLTRTLMLPSRISKAAIDHLIEHLPDTLSIFLSTTGFNLSASQWYQLTRPGIEITGTFCFSAEMTPSQAREITQILKPGAIVTTTATDREQLLAIASAVPTGVIFELKPTHMLIRGQVAACLKSGAILRLPKTITPINLASIAACMRPGVVLELSHWDDDLLPAIDALTHGAILALSVPYVAHIMGRMGVTWRDTLAAITEHLPPRCGLMTDGIWVITAQTETLSRHSLFSSPAPARPIAPDPLTPWPSSLRITGYVPESSAHPETEPSVSLSLAPRPIAKRQRSEPAGTMFLDQLTLQCQRSLANTSLAPLQSSSSSSSSSSASLYPAERPASEPSSATTLSESEPPATRSRLD